MDDAESAKAHHNGGSRVDDRREPVRKITETKWELHDRAVRYR